MSSATDDAAQPPADGAQPPGDAARAPGDAARAPADGAAEAAAGRAPHARAGGPAVVLVGPPGSGKSTAGGVLAERLGVGFRDTDADVAEAAGRPIPEIFLQDGEERFRELEAAAVRAAVADHDGVLALGGGAVLDPDTRALLTGLPVAFLDVPLADAVRRVGLDAPRPLLALNPRQQWRALMEVRRPLYTAVARAVVPTEGRSPQEVAEAVLDALEIVTT